MPAMSINEGLNIGESLADAELERVCDFLETLETIRSVRPFETTIDFAERTPVDLAVQRFLHCEHIEHDRSTRLYLEPRTASRFITGGLVEVDFLPRTSRAGKSSRHGVFFGDLGFVSPSNSLLPVAVKPYDEDYPRDFCVREYLNNVGFREQSLDCPRPIGLVLARDKAYFLSELDETLTTLDSIDWSDFHGSMDENPGMREIWSHVAKITAVLHSIGISAHCDLVPRNIAINADGSMRFIDLEESQIDTTPPRDAEVRFGNSYKDLKVLVEAMCRPLKIPQIPGVTPGGITHMVGIGLFNQPDRDWWVDFCNLFFDEYAQDRLALARNGSHHSRQEAEVQSEIDSLRQTLTGNVAMHKKFALSI